MQAIASYVQLYIAMHQAEADEPIQVKTAANLAMQLAYNNKDMLQVRVCANKQHSLCDVGIVLCHRTHDAYIFDRVDIRAKSPQVSPQVTSTISPEATDSPWVNGQQAKVQISTLML